MTILTVGIDTAKNVFAVHGVDAAGKVQLRQPKVARSKLNALIASLPPCVTSRLIIRISMKDLGV